MAISSQSFTISPADHTGRTVRRIFISDHAMKLANLCTGDVVALTPATDSQNKRTFAVGTIWPSSELAHDVVQLATSLLLTAHISEGSKAVILALSSLNTTRRPAWLPSLQGAPYADTVRLCEIDINGTPVDVTLSRKASEKVNPRDWLTLLVRESLVDLKYVLSTQVVQIQYEGKTLLFSISNVSTRTQNAESNLSESLGALRMSDVTTLYIVDWDTTVLMEDNARVSEPKPQTALDVGVSDQLQSDDPYAAVGGLDEQIAQIRDLIEIPLRRPELFRHFNLKPPRGLLLHGPPGTGKTHLARAISASTGSSVLTVNGPELTSAYHGETEASLRRVFAAARGRAPCIIILDEVDAICPRRIDDAGGEVEKRVVATLLTEMDGIDNNGTDAAARVVVVATTNRPNAIDPALRRPGRFDREIEIGVPDLAARISILNVLLAKTPHAITPSELHATASRAHGYVGADLAAVVREGGTLAIKRILSSSPSLPPQSTTSHLLTAADLAAALPTVRPSTLRAHAIAAPPVRFADIGGHADTIARLRECVEWPLVHRDTLARLGVRAPKGVLLCGPPGCCKTLLVRAIAAESGVNFVAVRGPELLNKYVGESERAVREIFRKARSASPSIVFFDEIDALASSRSPDDSSGAHEGVLLSMLNEMDGVEELVGVTVIGATNRPEALDPALMRPGRLDRILYVGPPDFADRVDILRIRTRNMAVDPALDLDALATLTSGCSGAEIAAICQEAALIAMREDVNAPFVPQRAFVAAAKALKRQITPEMLTKYERWRVEYGASTSSA